MFGLVVAIYVIVCIFLIAVILLQSGRGGGLAEMLGGGMSQQKLFGTETASFLTKTTTYAAIIFLVCAILLAVLISHKTRSMFDQTKILKQIEAQARANQAANAAKAGAATTATANSIAIQEPPATTEVPAAAEPIAQPQAEAPAVPAEGTPQPQS